MSSPNQVVLAVDPGLVHVGIALYQPQHGVSVLPSFTYSDLFQLERKLVDLLDSYRVEVLLVGDMGLAQLPKGLKQVLERIKRKRLIKIITYNEYLTSFQSESSKVHREARLDNHSAAALEILRDYVISK